MSGIFSMVDLEVNDDLQAIIRKCNMNFKNILAQLVSNNKDTEPTPQPTTSAFLEAHPINSVFITGDSSLYPADEYGGTWNNCGSQYLGTNPAPFYVWKRIG